MYDRISPRAVLRLYRQNLPRPVDVLNLIRFADREQYRWYGLFVAPTILGVGGGMLWAGRWEKRLLGEAQAEELLVVRYPSHRRFLLMTMSPYYALINRFRERGVAKFEASFTHASRCAPDLRRQKELLVVHYNNPAGRDVRKPLEAALLKLGAKPVYATSESSPIDCFRRRQPSDPNPLSYKSVIFCSLPAKGLKLDVKKSAPLRRVAKGLSMQIYARESMNNLTPEKMAPLLRLLRKRS
jgi:uncharacterized protein (DUF1330 family)